jgi:diaminopimelate dehydrogenase
MDRVRAGEMPELKPGEKHRRACYVAVEEEADRGAIAAAIQAMPNYFAGYDTSVAFVSPEELRKEHGRLPHGGSVIRTGITGAGHSQRIEFALELASNPEFTASVLVAGARAIHRMAARGVRGCVTMFDIPPADLISLSGEELRATLL